VKKNDEGGGEEEDTLSIIDAIIRQENVLLREAMRASKGIRGLSWKESSLCDSCATREILCGEEHTHTHM
jgi:hypothetical protein